MQSNQQTLAYKTSAIKQQPFAFKVNTIELAAIGLLGQCN